MKKVWAIIAVLTLIILAIASFIVVNWVPEKYAIKENEFDNYEPFILVKEVHYTGTGWVQVGNENGYFLPETYVDIDLVNGAILPQMEMYDKDYVNTFLCQVEYKGKVDHDAFEDQIESYYIVEWYPVYPILRDTILPNWMYPKDFMTKRELNNKKGDKSIIRVAGWDMEYTPSDRELTVEDFENIELGSSLDEIEKKLGKPDGWVGGGILSPVYILEDNSAVELVFGNDAADEDLVAIYLYKEQQEFILKKR